jgi:hypothetical protein
MAQGSRGRRSPAVLLHGRPSRRLGPWQAEVARADVARLDALVAIATEERIKLSECIRVTFGDHRSVKKAVAALSSFRKRINDAAKEAKLPLRLQVDTRLRSPPEERQCWFTGPDPAIASATAYRRTATEGQLVPSLGFAPPGALAAGNAGGIRLYAPRQQEAGRQLFRPGPPRIPRTEFEVGSMASPPRREVARSTRRSGRRLRPAIISPAPQQDSQRRAPAFRRRPNAQKPVLPVGLEKVHKDHHDSGLDSTDLPQAGAIFSGSGARTEEGLRLQPSRDPEAAGRVFKAPITRAPIPTRGALPAYRGYSVALATWKQRRRAGPGGAGRSSMGGEGTAPFFALLGPELARPRR